MEELIRSDSINVVFGSAAVITVFVLLSIFIKNANETLKKIFFIGIVLPAVISTVFLVTSTIYLNNISETKGPVHWHADMELWDCGTELDIVDPTGFSNKVGTSTLHEHNDKRLHVEGVVVSVDDASLENFFKVLGGRLTGDEILIPTVNGNITRKSGDSCPDGSIGYMQVFVYKTDTQAKSFSQQKLTNPQEYVLSPYSQIPPGDCVIIEFGPSKEKTDKLCNFYKVELQKGNLSGT